jgi:hypothetical protein
MEGAEPLNTSKLTWGNPETVKLAADAPALSSRPAAAATAPAAKGSGPRVG